MRLERTNLQRRLAFTLIELLTVIAITALLLTIIVVPVIQSFSITRTAQAFGEAQDRARIMTDKIAAEIGNSVAVRDLSSYYDAQIYTGTLPGGSGGGVLYTQVPTNSIAIVVPMVASDGSQLSPVIDTQVILPYAKIDIVPAANSSLGSPGAGMFRDPVTGKIDPTLHTYKGQTLLSVAPGQTIIRYWIGLHRPLAFAADGTTLIRNAYNEPYTGFLTSSNANRDNLYVLYRAEVQPLVYRKNTVSGLMGYFPNTTYFQSDAATDTQIVDEDDPNFFTLIPSVDYNVLNQLLSVPAGPQTLPEPATGQGSKAARIQAWQSKATLQSDVTRYDMIFAVYDKGTRKVTNNMGVPLVLPLAQFRPTRITAETVAGQTASRLGEETDSGAAIAPDVYTTQFSLISNPVVRTWPVGWDGTSNSGVAYQVGRRDINAGLALFAVQNGLADDTLAGSQLFNLDTYQTAISSGIAFPFSQAVTVANTNSNWLASGNAGARQVFTPYTINTATGKVIASFGITEVGNPANNLSNSVYMNLGENLPLAYTTANNGMSPAYDAFHDPTVNTGVFSDAAFSSINERFNKIWYDYSGNTGFQQNLHGQFDRFIDLRVTPQLDGVPSPLYPDVLDQEATGFGRTVDTNGHTRYSKTSIVPGSEEVIGPDELAGPHQGAAIRYTRVGSNPGPNEYQINYTDKPEPQDGNGNLDYSVRFPGMPNPQTNYESSSASPFVSSDFVTAILQPQFKAGYIKLCSDPAVPLPAGSITVTYRFQISGRRVGTIAQLGASIDQNASNADAFSVDYDSRQLMNVLLTVRNYPQANNVPNPQTVTLKSTANVRNYIR